MNEIQDLLQDYARTHTFCYNLESTSKLGHVYKKIDSCSIQNPVCGDRLTLYIYRDDAKDLFSFLHEGRYCALVHASSEILCQMLHQKTRDYITSVISTSLNFSNDSKNEKLKSSDKMHKIFLYMISSVFLSDFRKQCFLLPYKVCGIINKRIFKGAKAYV